MRLIDADKLIRTVRFLTLRDGKEIEIHYVEVERIDSAPTIDAVPVIRCKDCAKKELCSIFRDARQELGFCAWAERKEE